MTASGLPLLAGLLMGLAASLHCAAMCGAIAQALMLATTPRAAAGRVHGLMVTQGGRVVAYALAGGLLGAFGSGMAGLFDQAAAHRLLRWAAAMAVGWIGLSTAGVLPPLAALDRLALPIGRRIAALPAAAAGLPALATGIAWGFMPCAMVYGALFTALLTGSGAGGAALMFGFGLGTLPAVIATAFALDRLRQAGRSPAVRRAIGLAIAAYAGLSLWVGPEAGILCLPGS